MDLVQKEGESSEEYFMCACEILSCLDPKDENWLVNASLNGLIDDSFQRALDMARKAHRSMTLLQAYEQLVIMASPVNGTNIDSNCYAGIERSIAVENIPGYILVDAVAFQQFLVTNNLQPFYQRSGRYSEESSQILHHESSQLTEEETTHVAPLMKVSAEMALFQQNQHKTEIAAIKLAPVTKGAIPSNYDLSPIITPKAAAKPVPIETGTKGNFLRAFNLKPEVWGKSLLNENMKSSSNMMGEKEGKWREMINGINEGDKGKGVSKRDLGMEMDSFAEALVDTGCKWDAGAATGEKDVEWATSLAILVEHEIWAKEKHNTMAELESEYQPPSCEGSSGHSIQNPKVHKFQTASE